MTAVPPASAMVGRDGDERVDDGLAAVGAARGLLVVVGEHVDAVGDPDGDDDRRDHRADDADRHTEPPLQPESQITGTMIPAKGSSTPRTLRKFTQSVPG